MEYQQEKSLLINNLEQEGIKAQESNNLKLAQEKFQEIIDLQRNHCDSWYNLGVINYQLDDYKEAKLNLQQAISFNSDVSSYHYLLGLICEDLKEVDTAINAYQKALEIEPDLLDVLYNLGNIYYQTIGDISKAEKCYRKIIEIESESDEGYYNLGNIFTIKVQLDKALEQYNQAQKINPNSQLVQDKIKFVLSLKNKIEDAYLYSGNYFYARNCHLQAVEKYEQFFKNTQETNSVIFYKFADCYAITHPIEDTIKFYEKYLSQNPDSNIYLKLILALQEVGNMERAIEVSDKAISLFPDDLYLFLRANLLLPLIYSTVKEVEFHRQRLYEFLLSTRYERMDPTTNSSFNENMP